MTRRVIILGSTGSIGQQALAVIHAINQAQPETFSIVGLSANQNHELLAQQAAAFGVEDTCLAAGDPRTLEAFVKTIEADLAIVAVTGASGVLPTLAAIEAGQDIALANKEALVMAGAHIMKKVRETGVKMWPIDSEHAALFELLQGVERDEVDELILTCSGGAFREKSRAELMKVTAAEALQHPTWSMGSKITIDSATLMNKGFEVIEAHHLFQWPADKITIMYHPQSIVHGMLKMKDGRWRSHASLPDMKGPIRQALTAFRAPSAEAIVEQFEPGQEPVGMERFGQKLSFGTIDETVFRGVALCRKALSQGGMAPAVLTLANDRAVAEFLDGKIEFLGIYDRVEEALEAGISPGFSIERLRERIEKAAENR